MNIIVEEAVEEMIAEIHQWFDQTEKRDDAESTVKRTKLQSGIYDDVLLDYRPGRTTVDSLDLGMDEEGLKPGKNGVFTVEQVQTEIRPRLAQVIQERLERLADTPLIDYRFTFRGKFPTNEGSLRITLFESVNEEKKRLLLEQIHAYVDRKLTNGSYPTKPLETFFLVRHLLDPVLFPELDVSWIIAQYDRIQELNKGRQEALSEHRRNITQSLRDWAENQFLPLYFDVQRSAYRSSDYTLKPGASLGEHDRDHHPVRLLLYGAVMILRFEPNYSKSTGVTFLELAEQLGSSQAARMMKEGSGTFAKEDIQMRNEQVECTANDVFSTITVVVREEAAKAYEQALEYIIRLLKQGFPKSYKIKLKSKAKHYLPVKGLAKSDTHRFFANALVYPELHPLLEEYAREAMEEFEWYEDTEGEKNCMPGSYATFGLGLADERYFPLVEAYMGLVDDEHQMVQDKFATAFVEQHGLTDRSIPPLIACLRRSTDHLKLKVLQSELEDEDKLASLVEQVQRLPDYEVQRVLYPIWGKVEKLAGLARKAEGRRKDLLQALLKAAGK